jgi:BMFP domain-containing protein YqiC
MQVHTMAGLAKFEDVKVQLAKDLQQKKTDQLRSDLDKKLRQNAKIEEL